MIILDTIEINLLLGLGTCLLIQLLFYWIFLAKPYYHQLAVRKGLIKHPDWHPPVSVIIYARNEAVNLETYLPSVLEQNYPRFEVIVVNEDSNDDTEHVLKRLAVQYKHLYITFLPGKSRNVSRKKVALTIGIKAAQYDSLLFLEANCHPVSSNWLRNMARHFINKKQSEDQKKIVLGFSALEKYPSRYAAYDYFITNLQMMSLALYRSPYMGNGRNLGYNKAVFLQQKSFSKYHFIDAGEDDLLVSENASRENVSIEMSSESMVLVDMETYWMWKEYKIRHAVSNPFYKKFPRFLWRTEYFSRIAFWVSFVAALIFSIPVYSLSGWIIIGSAAASLLLRWTTQFFIINRTAYTLHLPKFWFTLPFFDFIQPFVNGYFYFYEILKGKKDNHWLYGKR
ncbi:MAG: glycosyltransferase [Candidatus Symbiothrix sp.]|jgi:glycosyltransferase involved in cell wall biosynthesis|nr:glycosyltransferase [Candidatus Symbiothrix sp.]